jgi:hypothetical protein
MQRKWGNRLVSSAAVITLGVFNDERLNLAGQTRT